MEDLLAADHLTLRHQSKDILRDVSLNIAANDFVTVIGPNGAGKTTLLKCLMGLVTPDSGSVIRSDGLSIGYVPQRFSADHTMPICARDFLLLNQKNNRHSLDNIAKETHISDLMDAMLYRLSGGELQRVLLARALLRKPDLLILDEPAQNLDISGQLRFYQLIEQVYAARNISILMVSHDLHLVMASSKQVICLFHHVCCSGTPQSVAQDPEFLSLFGDDMAKMLAIYHHEHDHHHHHDSAEPCTEHHTAGSHDR